MLSSRRWLRVNSSWLVGSCMVRLPSGGRSAVYHGEATGGRQAPAPPSPAEGRDVDQADALPGGAGRPGGGWGCCVGPSRVNRILPPPRSNIVKAVQLAPSLRATCPVASRRVPSGEKRSGPSASFRSVALISRTTLREEASNTRTA